MSCIVAVTSGKGGTGKSTFSVNLGLAAAEKGGKVLLVDMDAGMRCLDLLLGVSESVLMDVSDAVKGVDHMSAIIQTDRHSLFLLPAPAEADSVSPDGFAALTEKLQAEFTHIIIDFPAGADYTLCSRLPKGTTFITVCNPNPVSIRDAAVTGQALRKMKLHSLLVINKYNYKQIANPSFKTLDDIIDQTGQRLVGIIPESEKLAAAFSNGRFPKRGRIPAAFRRILSRIEGKSVPLPRPKKI